MGRYISRFEIKFCSSCGQIVEISGLDRTCPCGNEALQNIVLAHKESVDPLEPYTLQIGQTKAIRGDLRRSLPKVKTCI